MQQWVLDAEDIFNGIWAEVQEKHEKDASSADEKCITNKEVGIRFDIFIQELEHSLAEGIMS